MSLTIVNVLVSLQPSAEENVPRLSFSLKKGRSHAISELDFQPKRFPISQMESSMRNVPYWTYIRAEAILNMGP